MKLFRSYTFTWPQVSVFKISLVSLGIAIGSHWGSFFADYTWLFLGLAIVAGIYVTFAAFKK